MISIKPIICAGKKHRQQRGITLIETLVALAIMSLTTVSILVLVGQNTRFAAQSLERTYASIAVDNKMVEALALSGPFELGVEQGALVIAEREFEYRTTIAETGVNGLIRIDVDILNDGGQVIAHAQSLRSLR